MLLTFRLFLGAAGFVILALAVIARGLVPVPEVRTRVGEVPSVGRSLVQQTMIPPAFIDLADGPTRTRAEESTAARELSDTEVALVPAPASASTVTSPASEPALAAASRDETPSPSALPEVATTAETPVPREGACACIRGRECDRARNGRRRRTNRRSPIRGQEARSQGGRASLSIGQAHQEGQGLQAKIGSQTHKTREPWVERACFAQPDKGRAESAVSCRQAFASREFGGEPASGRTHCTFR